MRENSSRSKKNRYEGIHSALANTYGQLAGLRRFIGSSKEEQKQRSKLLSELVKSDDAQKAWLYLEEYFEKVELSRREFADEIWWQNFLNSTGKKRLEELSMQFLRKNIILPPELEEFANRDKLARIVQNEKEIFLAHDIEEWLGEPQNNVLKAPPSASFHVNCKLSKLDGKHIYVPSLTFCVKRPRTPLAERYLEEVRDIAARPSYEKELFDENEWLFMNWILKHLEAEKDSTFRYQPSPGFFQQLLVEWGESGLIFTDNENKKLDNSSHSSQPLNCFPIYYRNNFATVDIKVVRARINGKEGLNNLRTHLYLHLSTEKDIELKEAMFLSGTPSFILSGNEFFLLKGHRNADTLSAHISNPQLPLKHFSQSFIFNLKRKNCSSEISWEKICIPHKAKPRVVLELSDEIVKARLLAISELDKSVWLWNGKNWENTRSNERKNKDVLEYLDDARLPLITKWFHRFDWFTPEHGLWSTDADTTFLTNFAENWGSRPTDVEYLGNTNFQRLFLEPQKLRPKVILSGSGIDWLSVSAEWEMEGLRLTQADLQRLCTARGRFVKLPDAGWIELDEQGLLNAQEAIASLGMDDLSNKPQKVEMLHIVHLSEQTLSTLTGDGLPWLKEKIKEFKGIPSVQIPEGIHATLREYQQEGFNFLCWLARMGIGGILADDMGLGKTLQTLAWLLWLKENQKLEKCKKPSLVVCPASVVYNWKREVDKFAPGLNTLILESGVERKAMFRKIPTFDLIVINYNLLRRDLEYLTKFRFSAIVLDEAQYIKNPASQVAHAVKQLKASYRLALTGTPLENRLLDIWSITDFVQPGYLGTQQKFTQSYGNDCEKYDSKRKNNDCRSENSVPPLQEKSENLSSENTINPECKTCQQEQKNPVAQSRISHLAARLRPILLRRLKTEVARDLPPRIDQRRDCPLFEEQRKLYLAELRRSRELINQSVKKIGLNKSKIHVLAALMRLRQICCHPLLVGSDTLSGKTEALFDILETLQSEGQKVLVFSQFVEMLNILQKECEQRAYKTFLLTGATKKRKEVVNAFQESSDPAVFLLSLKAAGTGLNLTAASYVVLYDPWWNPAVEAQAIDRTHRIGQVKTVNAYRLIAPGTVEEKIWELQQLKSNTIDQVLGERDFTKGLTNEELQYLFSES